MISLTLFENAITKFDFLDDETVKDIYLLSNSIKENLGLTKLPIQFIKNNEIFVDGIIANISVNNTSLVIIPKFLDNDINQDKTLKTLFYRTLRCAGNSLASTVYFSKESLVSGQDAFVESIAKYFSDELADALNKSSIMRYEDTIEKTYNVKGQILFDKIFSNPNQDLKIWCKYKKSSTNNIYNQLLYWAANYLYQSKISFDLRKRLFQLMKLLPNDTHLLSNDEIVKLQLPRQYYAYSECFVLAKNLYLGNGGKMHQSDNKICGYSINMSKSFENIVCYYSRSCAYDLGLIHYSQASIRFAIASNSSEYDYFVRPDDIISFENKKLILDAKYKVIMSKGKPKPSREDFYQMISSCIAHSSKEAVLIYPWTKGANSNDWATVERINGDKIYIQSGFINILSSEKDLKDSFTNIIKNTLFFKEVQNG